MNAPLGRAALALIAWVGLTRSALQVVIVAILCAVGVVLLLSANSPWLRDRQTLILGVTLMTGLLAADLLVCRQLRTRALCVARGFGAQGEFYAARTLRVTRVGCAACLIANVLFLVVFVASFYVAVWTIDRTGWSDTAHLSTIASFESTAVTVLRGPRRLLACAATLIGVAWVMSYFRFVIRWREEVVRGECVELPASGQMAAASLLSLAVVVAACRARLGPDETLVTRRIEIVLANPEGPYFEVKTGTPLLLGESNVGTVYDVEMHPLDSRIFAEVRGDVIRERLSPDTVAVVQLPTLGLGGGRIQLVPARGYHPGGAAPPLAPSRDGNPETLVIGGVLQQSAIDRFINYELDDMALQITELTTRMNQLVIEITAMASADKPQSIPAKLDQLMAEVRTFNNSMSRLAAGGALKFWNRPAAPPPPPPPPEPEPKREPAAPRR